MALHFDEQLSEEMPDSVAVYELARPEVSPDGVAREARRFGLDGRGREFRTLGRWTEYREGSGQVTVHGDSGAVVFRDATRYGIGRDRAFEVSDDEAQGIARQFVSSSELVPADDDLAVEKVTHLRDSGAALDGSDRREMVLDAGVLLRRVVDGIRVAGPGGFAMINLDADRRIVGSRRVWRARQRRVGEVRPRSRDEATAGLETLAQRVMGDVRVVRAALSYLEFGQEDRQTHLEPAFVFVYLVENGDVVLKSAQVVPAGERGFGRLRGEKRFPTGPQPPRRPD
jgi:hypothetical protein